MVRWVRRPRFRLMQRIETISLDRMTPSVPPTFEIGLETGITRRAFGPRCLSTDVTSDGRYALPRLAYRHRNGDRHPRPMRIVGNVVVGPSLLGQYPIKHPGAEAFPGGRLDRLLSMLAPDPMQNRTHWVILDRTMSPPGDLPGRSAHHDERHSWQVRATPCQPEPRDRTVEGNGRRSG